MSQFKSNTQIKNQAKDILAGKYHHITFFILLYGMFAVTLNTLLTSLSVYALQFLSKLPFFENTLAAAILLELFSFGAVVLLGVFEVGVTLYFLNIACRQHYHNHNLYYGFENNFRKCLLLSLITSVISEICTLPYLYCYYQQQLEGKADLASLFLTYLLGIVLYDIITLGISQVYYLLLDFPELGVKDLFLKSIRLMRGHKKRLLLLKLSFIPLLLLGIMSFGIGLIWILPYTNMATTLFFLDIMKPQA